MILSCPHLPLTELYVRVSDSKDRNVFPNHVKMSRWEEERETFARHEVRELSRNCETTPAFIHVSRNREKGSTD